MTFSNAGSWCWLILVALSGCSGKVNLDIAEQEQEGGSGPALDGDPRMSTGGTSAAGRAGSSSGGTTNPRDPQGGSGAVGGIAGNAGGGEVGGMDPEACNDPVRQCDGVLDCRGGEDENPRRCSSDEHFACASGERIRLSDVCDGEPNCRDGSDERDPSCVRPPQFVCADGTMLSMGQGPCNQLVECRDGSDEADERCGMFQFRCPDGTLLPLVKQCDGVNDCSTAEDETSCGTQFRCTSNPSEIVPYAKVCDGAQDCRDGSDEINSICFPPQFVCSDGRMLGRDQGPCNGVIECADGSDERNCAVE